MLKNQNAVRAICNEVEALAKKYGKPKMLDAIKLPPPELYRHIEVCLHLLFLLILLYLDLLNYFMVLLSFLEFYYFVSIFNECSLYSLTHSKHRHVEDTSMFLFCLTISIFGLIEKAFVV